MASKRRIKLCDQTKLADILCPTHIQFVCFVIGCWMSRFTLNFECSFAMREDCDTAM